MTPNRSTQGTQSTAQADVSTIELTATSLTDSSKAIAQTENLTDLEDLVELGDLEDQLENLLLQAEAEEALKNAIFKNWESQKLLGDRGIAAKPVDVLIYPNEDWVEVQYDDMGQRLSVTIPLVDYLTPFLTVRLSRAKYYSTSQDLLNPNLILVWETVVKSRSDNPSGIPKPPREVIYDPTEGTLTCSCEDFAKQQTYFPHHPKLWEMMNGQPLCKHVMQTCLDEPLLLNVIQVQSPLFVDQIKQQACPPRWRNRFPVEPFYSQYETQDAIHAIWQMCQVAEMEALREMDEGQVNTVFHTTQPPEEWGMELDEFEQLRHQLLYFVRNLEGDRLSEHLAYLGQLALHLRLPDYFPTPDPLMEWLLENAELRPGLDVLECAAGDGRLAIAAMKWVAQRFEGAVLKPDVIEIQTILREVLRLQRLNVVGHNFLTFEGRKYHRIFTNTPFSQDVRFLKHAEKLVKPDEEGKGVIVMITSEKSLEDPESKLGQWLSTRNHNYQEVPRDLLNQGDRPMNGKGYLVKVVVTS